jgi:hypothetical protein
MQGVLDPASHPIIVASTVTQEKNAVFKAKSAQIAVQK